MRPLELIAKKALSFQCDISVARGGNRVDAKSFMHLLTLGAEAGMQVSIEATGVDSDQAVSLLASLIETNFEAFESSDRAF